MSRRVRNTALLLLREAAGLTQEQACTALARYLRGIPPDVRSWRMWESGQVRRPQAHYRAALRSLFGVTDAELGFQSRVPVDKPPEESSTVDDMRRRSLLGLVAAASVGAATPEPLSRVLEATRPTLPERVGLDEVLAVEAAAEAFMRMDLAHGGKPVAVAHGALNWGCALLTRDMGASVRARLESAVGLLADRYGWALYDSGDHAGARRVLTSALNHAARGPDRDLRAHVLLDLSSVTVDAGDARSGVEIIRFALGDLRVSSGERANCHAVCARHCGTAGDKRAGLRHVARAEEATTDDDPGDPPDWARRIAYAPGHLDSALGLALWELGEDDRAEQRLTAAVSRLDADRTRTGIRCRTRLAALYLRNGDSAGGEREAHRALANAPGVRSKRVAADLRMVAGEASRTGHHTLANDVRGFLREVV
ncbi:MAG: hypothetical protein ACJ73S_10275 [Mycobacteriales bacterium]